MKKPFGWIAIAIAALALAACEQPQPLPDQSGNVTDDCTGPRCEDVTDTK
jgi:predicted small lipoprotein YifL